ncbi:MAG TPA: hypothetical protein VGF55_32475 [Gemmataceae bacterium]
MPDQDLSGDDLKLVRYKILFTKRGYEFAFPEAEELVYDDMDGGRFTAWKISEFIQSIKDKDVNLRVSEKWGKYLLGKEEPGREYAVRQGNGYVIRDLPHDDKKFLRLFFEVLDRFPREDLRYEEQQLEILRDIRDDNRKRVAGDPPVRRAAAGGGGPEVVPAE